VQGEEKQDQQKDFANEKPEKPCSQMVDAKIFQTGVEQKFHQKPEKESQSQTETKKNLEG